MVSTLVDIFIISNIDGIQSQHKTKMPHYGIVRCHKITSLCGNLDYWTLSHHFLANQIVHHYVFPIVCKGLASC